MNLSGTCTIIDDYYSSSRLEETDTNRCVCLRRCEAAKHRGAAGRRGEEDSTDPVCRCLCVVPALQQLLVFLQCVVQRGGRQTEFTGQLKQTACQEILIHKEGLTKLKLNRFITTIQQLVSTEWTP